MISVMGTGRASSPPDIVRVRLTATALRPTLAVALTDSEDAARRLRAALSEQGVAAEDATTLSLAVNAEQVWTEQEGPRITGFRSEHDLAVTLRDIAEVGRSLGAALIAGGDDVRLNGLEFAVEDQGPLQVRAREAAWHDALARASQLATLAGRRLGAVEEISEQTGFAPQPPIMFRQMESGMAAPGMAVQPGVVDVVVSLAVRWVLDVAV